MLNLIRKSLQIELNNFFEIFPKKYLSLTKSAFVQNRKKLKPDVFKHLLNVSNNDFYTDNDDNVKKWNGYRLLAADLSRITLPITEELKKQFGISKNQHDTELVQAHSSVLYDLLNNKIIDGILAPISKRERELAKQHLQYAQKGDLAMYDRGYPSFEFIYLHNELKIDFVIRCTIDHNCQVSEFVSSNSTSQIIELKPGKNTLFKDKLFSKESTVTVRLVKVLLNSGETEVLITSLLDEHIYQTSIFKELYFMRWKIETFYDKFKNKLQVENFTTYSYQGIMQDFYCALLVSNIQSLIVAEAQSEIDEENKETKYKYKINENIAYGFLKNKIVSLLIDKNPERQLSELKELYKKNLIPIRPNRKNKRIKDKYRTRKKPIITKNFKQSF